MAAEIVREKESRQRMTMKLIQKQLEIGGRERGVGEEEEK